MERPSGSPDPLPYRKVRKGSVHRRLWLRRSVALVLLAGLVALAGRVAFAVGDQTAPLPLQPPFHLLLQRPLGAVDAPVITFNLAPGWMEQEQSSTDVQLAEQGNGSMAIEVLPTARLKEYSAQGVINEVEGSIELAQTTEGLPSPCAPRKPLTIGDRPGLEGGIRWDERTFTGKEFTNCLLIWASVEGGKVYYWSVFDTVDRMQADVAAADLMQRSAVWNE